MCFEYQIHQKLFLHNFTASKNDGSRRRKRKQVFPKTSKCKNSSISTTTSFEDEYNWEMENIADWENRSHGWNSDKTAETYNLRHIREEANRVMKEDIDHWTNRIKKEK